MEGGEYQLKVAESIKNVKYADIMISEEIIYWGIISKGITFELHLLLSIYPSLSLSLFISPYLFSCVFFISLLCVSLSLSQTSHTTLPMLNVFIIRSLNGLKILSFGHVNPRSGAPGAGGKGPLFVIMIIFLTPLFLL